jgi:hypothetical protein
MRQSQEQTIRQRLEDTIDVVCQDAARIELWADALASFALPVPDDAWGNVDRFKLS